MNNKLLETIADISYYAGVKGYYSGNSRVDVMNFIFWAQEFENMHRHTDWDNDDYILAISAYTENVILNEMNA